MLRIDGPDPLRALPKVPKDEVLTAFVAEPISARNRPRGDRLRRWCASWFGKRLSDLSIDEYLSLVAMLPAPDRSQAGARRRRPCRARDSNRRLLAGRCHRRPRELELRSRCPCGAASPSLSSPRRDAARVALRPEPDFLPPLSCVDRPPGALLGFLLGQRPCPHSLPRYARPCAPACRYSALVSTGHAATPWSAKD